jgi:hypothetical protein
MDASRTNSLPPGRVVHIRRGASPGVPPLR